MFIRCDQWSSYKDNGKDNDKYKNFFPSNSFFTYYKEEHHGVGYKMETVEKHVPCNYYGSINENGIFEQWKK